MIAYLFLLLSALLGASAQQAFCGLNANSQAIKIGSANALIVSDGPLNIGNTVFSVPAPSVIRSYAENFMTSDPIAAGQNLLLVDTAEGRTLIDTGSFGNQGGLFGMDAGLLMQTLAAADVSPESIDHILITHGHTDHVQGLIDENGEIAFPSATVYIGIEEHEFWVSDPLPLLVPGSEDQFMNTANVYRGAVLPYEDAGRLVLVPMNGMPLEGFQFIPTFGHSPGHNSIEITIDDDSLLVSGDLWITKADQLQNPEWGFFFETDRLASYESRLNFINKSIATNTRVLAYHEVFPGMGYIRQNGPFFEWVAIAPEQLGDVSRVCNSMDEEADASPTA